MLKISQEELKKCRKVAELSYEEMYELLSPECRHIFEKQKVELWEQAFA